MGWLFSETWPTRAVLREHLVNGNGVKTLKSCWSGNNLWAVQECTEGKYAGQKFIALYLCRNGKQRVWDYDVDYTLPKRMMKDVQILGEN